MKNCLRFLSSAGRYFEKTTERVTQKKLREVALRALEYTHETEGVTTFNEALQL